MTAGAVPCDMRTQSKHQHGTMGCHLRSMVDRTCRSSLQGGSRFLRHAAHGDHREVSAQTSDELRLQASMMSSTTTQRRMWLSYKHTSTAHLELQHGRLLPDPCQVTSEVTALEKLRLDIWRRTQRHSHLTSTHAMYLFTNRPMTAPLAASGARAARNSLPNSWLANPPGRSERTISITAENAAT